MDLPGPWIDQAHQHRELTKLILDMDSSVSETRQLFAAMLEQIGRLRLVWASG
jgi:hypothetical protein